jgi:hypothetical protein
MPELHPSIAVHFVFLATYDSVYWGAKLKQITSIRIKIKKYERWLQVN